MLVRATTAGSLALFACLFTSIEVRAQFTPLPASGEPCGFDGVHRHLMDTDQGYRDRVGDFEENVRHFDMDSRDAGTFFIPVVVHVMETGNSLTQITDDEIRAAIKAVNERYRKVAGTLGAGTGVDTHIEFALAVRDPSGSCTTGITRTNMTGNATYMANGVARSTANGISDASLKIYDIWDPVRYYNIWLVSEIDNNNGGNGTGGFASFPAAHGTSVDGCIAVCNYVKDNTSTVLAHELGHALGLYHTFEGDGTGSTCPPNADCSTQGDLVCDTPPHKRSPSDCNTGGTNSCDGGSSNLLFVRNYMDYSSAACENMFTAGQNTRIQTAVSITRASYLPANGNMSLVPPGAPTMQIIASKVILCGTGQSVQLFDWSRCIPNTYLTDPDLPGITWAWTITNGTETQNSSVQNPVFTLNSLGVFNATLQITTSLGTYTRTENGIVVVGASPAAACTPTSLNPSGNYGLTVYNVVFNAINSPTSVNGSVVYTDYACSRNTVVTRGSTYQLSVSITSGSASTESFNAYIDYNNNNIFDTGEQVSSGSIANGSTTVNANVTIPVTAVTGALLRLRVYGEVGGFTDPERTCSAQMLVADVEDYGVYVTTNTAGVSIAASPSTTISYGTNVTFTPTPVNGGGAPTYQWFRNGSPVSVGATYASNNLVQGETISCEMFSNMAGVVSSPATSNTLTMTVTGPPLSDFTGSQQRVCAGGSVAFTNTSLLAPTSWSWSFPGGTPSSSSIQNPTITYSTPGTYNVVLTASNGSGTGSTMTKTGYITVSSTPASGCSVTRALGIAGNIGITNVSLNTINNYTPDDDAVMNNFTCSISTSLQTNTLYNVGVTVSPFNSQWVRVYIDYNNNGVFTDSGEQIFAPANGPGARTGTFTTPASPPLTNTLLRMRVITDFVNTAAGPCTALDYGQVEEYGVVLVPLPNTAPVLNSGATPVLASMNEDGGSPSGAVGTLVSALVDLTPPAGGLDNVTDADAGALTGIAVTAADAANGSWFYSTNDGGAWNALGVPSGSVSRLLAADASTRLYFQPNANFNGSIPLAITFRAWDRTTGTNGNTADASVNGGSTAYSTATDVAGLTVTSMNDAPVLNAAASPALSAQVEDPGAPSGAVGTLVSTLLDLNPPAGGLDNVTDVDVAPVTGIAITAADATNGSWFYSLNNGGAWNALGTPSGPVSRLLAADVNARLYFQPSANFNGSIASAITFRAWDQSSGTTGNTADASVNGGISAFSTATDVASIVVTSANDAPVLNSAASPALTAVNEDAGAPSGAVGTLVSALVDLTPPAGGLDNVTDPDAAPLTGIAITSADLANGSWFYSINNGSAWNALGLPSGSSSRVLAADGNARLYFQPNANFNGSIASALTFRAWDQTSGTSGGTADASVNGGTTAFSTTTDVTSISVTGVNDAPVLNTAASPALGAQNENAGAPSGAVGTLISTLVDLTAPAGGLDNVSEVDAAPLTGIAITASDASNGSWFYSINNGGIWSALGAPTGIASRLLAADANARLYFQPNASFNGSIASAITFRAWDQTSGTNGSTADASINGGITAFSSATDVASIVVISVNDAPVLNTAASPALNTMIEDAGAPSGAVGALVSSLVDLNPPAGGLDNVTDPNAAPLTGIAITAADANGTWFYSINNGGVWNALGSPTGSASRLLAADANARVYFQPNANFNGSIASALTFRAWDQTSGTNGSTADASVNGGITAFSTATDVASISITAVNDAPVLNTAASPALGALNENAGAPSGPVGTLVSTLVDPTTPAGGLDNVSEVDAAPVTGMAITAADVTSGSWFYSTNNGGVWNALGTPTGVSSRLLAADANSRVYFQPNAGFNGTIPSALTFRAWDQTSGTNGGTADASINGGITAFSSATDVASLTIIPAVVQVSARAFLEGPYDASTGVMGDALRSGGLIPATEPFTGLGYAFVGGGGETVAPAVLTVTGNNAVVDWVILELRDNSTPTTVLASKSVLVQRDGDVVATDGVSTVTFTASPGTYRIALRHRNHVGVMTLNGVALSSSPASVNFTSVATATYGTAALKSISGTFPTQALWAGDVTFDHTVKYTGSSNDRDPILVTVGSTTPNNIISNTYSTRDVNMNGSVLYTGSGNDRDPILVNVGSTTPNNIRLEQVP